MDENRLSRIALVAFAVATAVGCGGGADIPAATDGSRSDAVMDSGAAASYTYACPTGTNRTALYRLAPGVDLGDCADPDWLACLVTYQHPAYVARVVYHGEPSFFVMAGCCDQFNVLFDRCGTELCAPSGGISGIGNGRCPDYENEAESDLRVWPEP
jgi:hypothetical protein